MRLRSQVNAFGRCFQPIFHNHFWTHLPVNFKKLSRALKTEKRDHDACIYGQMKTYLQGWEGWGCSAAPVGAPSWRTGRCQRSRTSDCHTATGMPTRCPARAGDNHGYYSPVVLKRLCAKDPKIDMHCHVKYFSWEPPGIWLFWGSHSPARKGWELSYLEGVDYRDCWLQRAVGDTHG